LHLAISGQGMVPSAFSYSVGIPEEGTYTADEQWIYRRGVYLGLGLGFGLLLPVRLCGTAGVDEILQGRPHWPSRWRGGAQTPKVFQLSVPISTSKLLRSRRDQVPRTEHPGRKTQCQSGFLWARLGVTTLRGIEREYARDGQRANCRARSIRARHQSSPLSS